MTFDTHWSLFSPLSHYKCALRYFKKGYLLDTRTSASEIDELQNWLISFLDFLHEGR